MADRIRKLELAGWNHHRSAHLRQQSLWQQRNCSQDDDRRASGYNNTVAQKTFERRSSGVVKITADSKKSDWASLSSLPCVYVAFLL